jgi:tetratricopeptide (TPR) repeat protein
VLIHGQVGESLLRHHAAQAERVAATLALHFERARDFERAVAYHAQAGENALNVLANVEADAHFTAALSCADRLAEGARDRARSPLLRCRGLARNAMGRADSAVEDLRAALAAARATGDGGAQGKALTTLTRSLLYAHRVGDALPFAREAVALGAQLGDEVLRVEGYVYVANLQGAMGDVGEALRTIESLGDGQPLAALPHAFLRYWRSEYARAEALLLSTRRLFLDAGFTLFREMFLGLVVGNLGRLSEARSILVTARDLAKKSGNVAFEARLENCIGWVLRELGDAAGAVVHDARSEELARSIKESEPEAHAIVNLVDDAMTTRTASGLAARFAQVEALAKNDDWMSWRYLIRLQASRACERLASGTPEEARVAIDSLYATASRYDAGKYRAIAKELAARAALSVGDFGAATRAIAEARALLADRPVPVMAWKVETLGADIASRVGDLEAAAAARTSAHAMVQSLAEHLPPEDRATFLASPAGRAIAREA